MDVTLKKAEHQRIDAFELWCWRKLLRVPWAARRSNQSVLKEISPEYSLERLMPKLNLQYFDHLIWRADSSTLLGKTLVLGKIEGRRRGWQRTRWLDDITDLMYMSLSKGLSGVFSNTTVQKHQFFGAQLSSQSNHLADGEGQGNLACCSPRDCKQSDTTATEQQHGTQCSQCPLNSLIVKSVISWTL